MIKLVKKNIFIQKFKQGGASKSDKLIMLEWLAQHIYHKNDILSLSKAEKRKIKLLAKTMGDLYEKLDSYKNYLYNNSYQSIIDLLTDDEVLYGDTSATSRENPISDSSATSRENPISDSSGLTPIVDINPEIKNQDSIPTNNTYTSKFGKTATLGDLTLQEGINSLTDAWKWVYKHRKDKSDTFEYNNKLYKALFSDDLENIPEDTPPTSEKQNLLQTGGGEPNSPVLKSIIKFMPFLKYYQY